MKLRTKFFYTLGAIDYCLVVMNGVLHRPGMCFVMMLCGVLNCMIAEIFEREEKNG